MRRFLKLSGSALISIALVFFAHANATYVRINFFPEGLARYLGWHSTLDVPLFIIIATAFILGVGLAGALLWLRLKRLGRQIARYKKDITRLEALHIPKRNDAKETPDTPEKEQLLALLETPPKAR